MNKRSAIAAAVFAPLFLAPVLFAQPSQDAMQLLNQVSKTYRGLSHYEIRAVVFEDQRWDEARQLSETPFVMAEDTPDKFRIESKHPFMGGIEVSDGTTTWRYMGMGHQYTKKPATLPTDLPADSPFRPTNYVEHYRQLAGKASQAHLLREEPLPFEGKETPCAVVEVQFKPGADKGEGANPPHTFWIGKESGLVLQEMWERKASMPGLSSKTSITVVYKTIHIQQPVAQALFTFTAPPDAKEVEDLSLPGMSASIAMTGKAGPDFSLSTLDGKKVSLSGFKGQTVLLDFWATWCVPCRESTPIVEKLHAGFGGKGLVVLAVNFGEDPSVVKSYLAHNPSAIPSFLDPENSAANLYKVNSIPAFIVISKDGKVASWLSGFGEDTEIKLRAALRQEGLE